MGGEAFTFWVTLPPCTEDLTLLTAAAGLAEPLVDLRYGAAGLKRSIADAALRAGLSGVTVLADARETDLVQSLRQTLPAGSRVVFAQPPREDAQAKALVEAFAGMGVQVAFEVDCRPGADSAEAAGVDFLVVSTNEACGAVSPKTSLVAIQELCPSAGVPLVIRGSLGPQGSAAVMAAGCAGCILDSQLLLAAESPVPAGTAAALARRGSLDTVIVGAMVGRPYRLLPIAGADGLADLQERERAIFLSADSAEAKADAFERQLQPLLRQGLADDAALPPVGQGLAFAQQFARENMGVREIIGAYRSALGGPIGLVKKYFPLGAGSPLANAHKVSWPLVQGPMAHISSDPRLASEVARHGALPFVAAGGKTPAATRRLIVETRAALGDKPFGVGLIAFANAERLAEQIDAVVDERPAFVLVAGGDAHLARRLSEAGIGVYLHAPSPAHVKDFLDHGVEGIVLEGAEAGGHVGKLGSLVLWELAVREILARREAPAVRLLFAGGIATSRGALAAAVVAAEALGAGPADGGVAFGLQLGTAYLMTPEAVACGAIPAAYQEHLLAGGDTVVLGGSVNLPARWLASAPVTEMLREELTWLAEPLPLGERKERFERQNLAALREAARPTRDESADRGRVGHMCGQAICLQSQPLALGDLHESLTSGAERLAQAITQPVRRDDLDDDAIAIVGMGCIVPGASDPAEYWDNIVRGKSAVREVPPDRWDHHMYYDPDPAAKDKSSSRLGAFVEGFEKDPLKFRIPPLVARSIDRAQFFALEVAHQALSDAGYLAEGFPKDRTAVIVGSSGGSELGVQYCLRTHTGRFMAALRSAGDFQALPADVQAAMAAETQEGFTRPLPEFTEDTCGGVFGSIVASRVANCFDLGGGAVTIDAACASSLAAVAEGMAALRDGRCDLVLAGGVDARVDPTTYVFFSSLGALSDDGSFPFDDRANGFILGEGAGMVLLKRYADARRDGDTIHAVIRSVGSTTDGRAKAVTAPDVTGQVRAIEAAYELQPFTPADISLVEAHGTSTSMGDYTEITSLSQAFGRYVKRKRSIPMGSVKSTIGHLKSAAGIASLIKTVMALKHRLLPPTINCQHPRSDVDWENCPLYLIAEPTAWVADGAPRRAAVESFGFGGVNYHMVLEEAPQQDGDNAEPQAPPTTQAEMPAELLVFRAQTPDALRQALAAARGELAGAAAADLRRIALDLQDRPSPVGPALAIVATDGDDALAKLAQADKVLADGDRSEYIAASGIYYSRTPLGAGEKVAFLYPGQGSQYVNMVGDLAACFRPVGSILEEVDDVVRGVTGHSVLEPIRCPEQMSDEQRQQHEQRLLRTDYNHPALLAMGMGIGEVLHRAGVDAAMVAGHSLGEYTALHAAGVFDRRAAVALTTARGCRIYEHSFQSGAMAGVRGPVDQVEQVLAEVSGFVAVANKNCPAQTVISGDVEAVHDAMARLGDLGVECMQLPVASGFHTPLLASCVASFHRSLAKVRIHPPKLAVQSNLTGRAHQTDGDFAGRLRQTLARHMTRPVEFISNVESMYADGARLFLEVGPGSTLCSFVDSILGQRPHWTCPTNVQRRGATLQLLHALGLCAAKGLAVNLRGILPSARPSRRIRQASRARPASRPADRTAAPVGPAAVVADALAAEDAAAVRQYLQRRGEFVKSMIRLDYQHFTGSDTAGDTSAGTDKITRRIIELVAEKTGYPPDVIDLDLDVEAELGLDSIKQVAIVRELSEALGAELPAGDGVGRYHMTTLRQLAEGFRQALAGQAAPEAPTATDEVVEPPTDEPDAWDTACHRWVCQTIETPLTAPADAKALAGRLVVLLAEESEAAQCLHRKLTNLQADVRLVRPDDGPAALPEEIDVVVDVSAGPARSCPGLDDLDDWWRQAERRATVVLTAARRLVRSGRGKDRDKALWVEVTSLGGRLGDGSIARPSPAAGIGLGISRCLFAEHADVLEVLYLDFDGEGPAAQLAERVGDELTRPVGHREIGYAGAKRVQIHWKADDDGPPAGDLPLDADGVVLAIGGARGITASICRSLAEQTRAHFVLVGSGPAPGSEEVAAEEVTFPAARDAILVEASGKGERVVPAEVDRLAWQRVWAAERQRNCAAMRGAGARVDYRRCDVTDARALRDIVEDIQRTHGRIDVVIQGAGVLVEKSTVDFQPGQFIAAMKPKAFGTACLLAALEGVDVGAMVHLSSIVGRWGYLGLAAYASGHEVAGVLVAAAGARRTGRWLTLLYGPWLNVGMTRLGSTLDRLRQRRSGFVSEQGGVTFFVRELAGGDSCTASYRAGEHFGLFLGRQGGPGGPAETRGLLDAVEVTAAGLAEGRKTFDVAHDRYIVDHAVAGEPILPGIVALEMLAQTASLLADASAALTAIEAVRFLRPVRFPRGQPREIRATVEPLPGDEAGAWFAGELYSVPGPIDGDRAERVVHVRCRMCFGIRGEPPEPSLVVVGTGPPDSRVNAKGIWQSWLGCDRKGIYRQVRWVNPPTADGIIGEVLAPQVRQFGQRPLTDNPVRLDGMIILWTLQRSVHAEELNHYLTAVDRISFFAADHPEESRLVRLRRRKPAEDSITFDLEATDSIGRVTERMAGVVTFPAVQGDTRATAEPIWRDLSVNPQTRRIAELLSCPGPIALTWVPVSLVGGAIVGDEGSRLLREQLARWEAERFEAMDHPKRRREWLAGRLAAKAAVRVLAGAAAPPAAAIEIHNGPGGGPYVRIPGDHDGAQAHISIAHSGEMAVAGASRGSAVGVDVEVVSAGIKEITEAFCRGDEVRRLEALPGMTEVLALTSLWAAKEAVRKWAGADGCSMKELTLRDVSADGAFVVCRFAGPLAAAATAVTLQANEYIYAVSVAGGGDAGQG